MQAAIGPPPTNTALPAATPTPVAPRAVEPATAPPPGLAAPPDLAPAPTTGRALAVVLASAVAKRLRSVWRQWMKTRVHADWQERVRTCATCPVARQVGKTVYCGRPLLESPIRRPEDGCGCPVVLKAKDPDEHCPLDGRFGPSMRLPPPGGCTCRWCASSRLKTAKTGVATATL